MLTRYHGELLVGHLVRCGVSARLLVGGETGRRDGDKAATVRTGSQTAAAAASEELRPWFEGSVRVLVTTTVGEAGISNPRCNLVLVAGSAYSMISFAQASGRAGRARQPARVVLVYAAHIVARHFGQRST